VAAGANYHRGVCTISNFTGSGAIVVQVEVSLDNSVWTPLASSAAVAITGSGTWEVPSAAFCIPFPAIAARLNVTAWPAGISGTLDGYVISN
jgi:hypothetical protein